MFLDVVVYGPFGLCLAVLSRSRRLPPASVSCCLVGALYVYGVAAAVGVSGRVASGMRLDVRFRYGRSVSVVVLGYGVWVMLSS